MPKRLPLVAGLVLASTTSVYAVRPLETASSAFQIDMQANEYCHHLAIAALRHATALGTTTEQALAPKTDSAERISRLLIQTQTDTGESSNFIVRCHTAWTEDGIILFDLGIDEH